MDKKFTRYEIKETKEIVFRVDGMRSRFVEGHEYVPIVRSIDDKTVGYFLREALRKVE